MWVIYPNDITVDYEEMSPSPEGTHAADMQSTVRIFQCVWNQRMLFIKQLLGWSEFLAGNQFIHSAHSYQPEGMLKPQLCVEISSIKGFGALVESPEDIHIAEYHKALITARYEIPTFEINEDPSVPYISESIEPASEFMTLNNEGLYWDAGQVNPIGSSEAPSMIIRMFDWVYTLHRCAAIPSELVTLIGCTNLYPIYSRVLNMWFAPGTLLLGNPTMQREHTSLGTSMWTITIRLTAREMGWNNFPWPSEVDAFGNVWWGPIYDGVGVRLYPYTPVDLSGFVI